MNLGLISVDWYLPFCASMYLMYLSKHMKMYIKRYEVSVPGLAKTGRRGLVRLTGLEFRGSVSLDRVDSTTCLLVDRSELERVVFTFVLSGQLPSGQR